MASSLDFIGPFQLVRLVRSGQTTQVWEVLEEGKAERIAIKVLHKEFAKDKNEIEQLRHEAEVAKNFEHPNVIKIFRFYGEAIRPLIAMELFLGRNLKLILRDNPLQIRENITAVIQGCALGLEHVHSKGWVHSDVKPDNFLLDQNNQVKVIDFSISQKQPRGLSRLWSRPRSVRGTRSYIAPEQILRRPPGPLADIYSFGCVLFELVSGRPPFTAPNPNELLSRHLHSEPPFLQSLNRQATTAFSNLVSKMMSKKPAQRPKSMKDFLVEFEKTPVFKAGTLRKQAGK